MLKEICKITGTFEEQMKNKPESNTLAPTSLKNSNSPSSLNSSSNSNGLNKSNNLSESDSDNYLPQERLA